jgi:hypothetical protein
MVREAPHCKGTRRDGSPCNAQALLTSGYCFAHDPDNQVTAAKARADGGRGRAKLRRAEKLLPNVLRPVLAKLTAAIDETHAGTLDPRQATAMAALASAVVRVFTSGTLEERLAALEEAAQTPVEERRRA